MSRKRKITPDPQSPMRVSGQAGQPAPARPRRRQPAPVSTRIAPAYAAALERAGGDRGRLIVCPDGSVIVTNRRRPGPR